MADTVGTKEVSKKEAPVSLKDKADTRIKETKTVTVKDLIDLDSIEVVETKKKGK